MEEKSPGIIRRSFGKLMSFITWLRLVVVNLVFVLIVVLIFIAFSANKLPVVPKSGALILNISGSLVDQLSFSDPLALLMSGTSSQRQETLLKDVIDAITYAKEDERINTLVLKLDNLNHGGISKMQEIAVALDDFRKSDKKIIAMGDHFNQDQYWLAAQADEIYVHPLGGVSLEGYGLYRNYYKQALDKLEIDVHVFRVGEFKSAMEPFMRTDMSKEARESNLVWLQSLWSNYINGVAVRRKLQSSDIDNYVNDFDTLLTKNEGNSAAAAMSAGLIDGVKTRHEMATYLTKIVGAADDNESYSGIDFEQYLWIKKIEIPQLNTPKAVGVIVASGNIVDGDQPVGVIGGDTFSDLIRKARRDKTVEAVVLRIDSGGGSMFASEVIRRELELLKKSGKPLVVSMGSMAASGGYWISALADEIWAMPTTLTGSIGIFGAFPTIDQTLGKLGITTDGVGTTKVAGSMRIDRPLTTATERTIQTTIEFGYKQFISIVADGRNMSADEVKKIAGGRVWTGSDALEIGLVDKLGGLEGAIVAAASLANLDSYRMKLIEQPRSPQEKLIQELMSSVLVRNVLADRQSTNMPVLGQLQRLILPFTKSVGFINSMNDPHNVYLHCTACIAP
ncbi:MAG: protease-4 [Oceanicoccus sp.]|jgi:protease-4